MQKYISLPDTELVHLYLEANNKDALECILYRHKDKLLQSILYWGIQRDDAENIAQEAMYKAIDSLNKGKYTSENKFFPWILRIARNLMIDMKRREKRGKEIIQDKYLHLKTSQQVNMEDLILNRFEHDHLKEKLYYSLDLLKPNQREIIELRIFEELSFKEISEKLDISINTALGRMRYALMNLRKVWESSMVKD